MMTLAESRLTGLNQCKISKKFDLLLLNVEHIKESIKKVAACTSGVAEGIKRTYRQQTLYLEIEKGLHVVGPSYNFVCIIP